MTGKRHGQRNTPEYTCWDSMVQRCCNPNSRAFKDYGGRGITVIPAWRESFLTFQADMGPRPTPLHTLERIRNHEGYSPANCRWATRAEQSRNRRINISLTFNGKTMVVKDWEKETGIPDSTIISRLEKGLPIAEVLNPTRKRFVGKRRFLTHNGETLSLVEWAKKIGIDRGTISERLRNGASVEMALMKGRIPERGPRRGSR